MSSNTLQRTNVNSMGVTSRVSAWKDFVYGDAPMPQTTAAQPAWEPSERWLSSSN